MTRRPCVSDLEAGTCAAALLHGVPCCPDRSCLWCVEEMRLEERDGHQVHTTHPSGRAPRRCPICGCPPPSMAIAYPMLPPVDGGDMRRTRTRVRNCVVCDAPLTVRQRTLCSEECRLAQRRDLWPVESGRRLPESPEEA